MCGGMRSPGRFPHLKNAEGTRLPSPRIDKMWGGKQFGLPL